MKTPISYYGGKQQLAPKIIPLIPKHKLYCEPFSGGLAVFFAKKPSEVEVINDINGELVNFYQVLKHDFNALQKEVEVSLHSRALYGQARDVYKNPQMFDGVKRAWALWMLCNSSFGKDIKKGFGFDRMGKNAMALARHC